MSAAGLVQVLLWVTYPVLIFFGLQVLEPRYVAALLGLLLLLRRRRMAGELLKGLSRADIAILLFMLAWTGAVALTNDETLLRLYPAAVNLGMLLLFWLSLEFPPTMIERFARLTEPGLPESGVRYTRRVTQVWCAFFVANGAAAVYTALYASRMAWELYNGFIAYLLMGALFAGEWLLRRYLVPARPAGPRK